MTNVIRLPRTTVLNGFVAYTNDLNVELDEEDAYAINSLDNYDESKIQQMCNDVRAARRDGAEFIVAMVYAGDVYNTEPVRVKRRCLTICLRPVQIL